jgi:hypothetical protein
MRLGRTGGWPLAGWRGRLWLFFLLVRLFVSLPGQISAQNYFVKNRTTYGIAQ